MTTQAQPSSQDLAAARELLDELDAATQRAETDSQTTAITAAAHSILVLAEQVAAIRVLIVGDAMARRSDGQPVPQADGQPVPRADGQPVSQADGEPVSQADGQPAPEAKNTRRKRGWW